MLNSIQSSFLDDILFYQKIRIRRKLTNDELLLFDYFYNITKIYPHNVIIAKNIIFYFINNEKYFEAKSSLPYLRRKFAKRIVLVREENIFIKLLFGFFPDPYIHDLRIDRNPTTGKRELIVGFLSFEERGIAVGCNGDYIKAVNEIFENYVLFENKNGLPIRIRCEVFELRT